VNIQWTLIVDVNFNGLLVNFFSEDLVNTCRVCGFQLVLMDFSCKIFSPPHIDLGLI
jgi:hypothetical protein